MHTRSHAHYSSVSPFTPSPCALLLHPPPRVASHTLLHPPSSSFHKPFCTNGSMCDQKHFKPSTLQPPPNLKPFKLEALQTSDALLHSLTQQIFPSPLLPSSHTHAHFKLNKPSHVQKTTAPLPPPRPQAPPASPPPSPSPSPRTCAASEQPPG